MINITLQTLIQTHQTKSSHSIDDGLSNTSSVLFPIYDYLFYFGILNEVVFATGAQHQQSGGRTTVMVVSGATMVTV